MKPNRFMLIISILTFLVILAGSTFAYFLVSTSSAEGEVATEAAVINIKLDILPLYTGETLIPTNDADINTAYQNQCIDRYNRGACSAYAIKVRNDGQDTEFVGTINFELEDITNFKYLVLDSNGNTYQNTVIVDAGTEQSLGNKFSLTSGTEKTFTLIMWLPNFNYDQTNDDGSGNFNATITYASAFGSRVTGTFSS